MFNRASLLLIWVRAVPGSIQWSIVSQREKFEYPSHDVRKVGDKGFSSIAKGLGNGTFQPVGKMDTGAPYILLVGKLSHDPGAIGKLPFCSCLVYIYADYTYDAMKNEYVIPMKLATSLVVMAFLGSGPSLGSTTIDDFSQAGQSTLGTRWEAFTDRVMGGRSTMDARFVDGQWGRGLYFAGDVTTANNGGFAQARLPLANGGNFDASDSRGIEIRGQSGQGRYYIHLRTPDAPLPWQYYSAPLNFEDGVARMLWSDFQGESVRRQLDPSRLRSLAIVAANGDFRAEILVTRIELF